MYSPLQLSSISFPLYLIGNFPASYRGGKTGRFQCGTGNKLLNYYEKKQNNG